MKKDKYYFIKNIEKMVTPQDVGNLQFLQNFNKLLSRKQQLKALEKSAINSPFMSFIVEPYSTFMCFEITNLKLAQELIPSGFKLAKTKIFASDDEPKYYCIIGVFNVHTSAFWGSRLEFNIIATKESTNMLSWVIVDFDSNTINHSNKYGLSSKTTQHFVNTTDYNGNVIIDVLGKNNFKTDFNLKNRPLKHLDQTLWLDGNFSVAYGKDISNDSNATFSMIFNNLEAHEAFEIEPSSVCIDENTWFKKLFKNKPVKVVCFPYAQHFLSDSPGHDSKITTKEDMNNLYNELDFSNIKNYSSSDIMKKMKIGLILSSLITIVSMIIILILLIYK